MKHCFSKYLAISCLALSSPIVLALSGGLVTSPLKFSAIVLLKLETDEDEWNCTATKISPYKYLTAAHCVSDPGLGKLITIRRISMSHGNSEDSTFFQEVTVRKFSIHPDWENHVYLLPLRRPEDRLETGSDQAILEIVESNDLPILPLDFDEVVDGEVLLAAGYGVQSVSPGYYLPAGEFRVLQKKVTKSFFQPKVVSLGALDANNKTYSQFAPGDSGGPILRLKPADRIPFAPKLSVVGTMSYIQHLIYVDPDTGLLNHEYKEEPTSHFVRNQALSYLFQLKGLERSFRLSSWLEQESRYFQLKP